MPLRNFAGRHLTLRGDLVKVYILASTHRGLYDGITAVYLSKLEADKALKHLGRHDGNTENFIEAYVVTEKQKRWKLCIKNDKEGENRDRSFSS